MQAVSATLFKARALPLHVNVTHTPPVVGEDNGEAPADPGFLGLLALQPSTFTTGSYGWKGSKRLTIELVDPDSEEKEKVQVMLTCVSYEYLGDLTDCLRTRVNATVLGSKQAAKEVEVGGEDDDAAGDTNNAKEDNAPKPQSTD